MTTAFPTTIKKASKDIKNPKIMLVFAAELTVPLVSGITPNAEEAHRSQRVQAAVLSSVYPSRCAKHTVSWCRQLLI